MKNLTISSGTIIIESVSQTEKIYLNSSSNVFHVDQNLSCFLLIPYFNNKHLKIIMKQTSRLGGTKDKL